MVGARDEKTLLHLKEQLPKSQRYYTDNYSVYRKVLPEHKHATGKEGKHKSWHSVLRDSLARLRRSTKAYSKSLLMLEASIALVAWIKGWI